MFIENIHLYLKKNIIRSPSSFMDTIDHFRESFKYFKQHKNALASTEIIDFEKTENNSVIIASLFKDSKTDNASCNICEKLGLTPHQTWSIFSVKDLHGFYYIKNPFSVIGQRQWIQKCLKLYPEKPSVTNLDRHYQKTENSSQLVNLEKLCWATLGYHYNWDAKEYNPNHYSPLPECLKALSRHVASCLKFESFTPDTAIVNYYHRKSRLSIHNDHSEMALDQPIISFSFGQPAIFLAGTPERTNKPVPMLLKSGDIIIFSGKSRLAYHAVPIILLDSKMTCYGTEDGTDFWSSCYSYISQHRINISVRQAYNKVQNDENEIVVE